MPAMEISAFWDIIESARSSTGQPFDEALTDILAARPWPDIAEFYEQFSELKSALHRHDERGAPRPPP
jgi:hypothetical protein